MLKYVKRGEFMKKIFNKNTIPYIIFNSISGLLLLYFILRLYDVIKKVLLVPNFEYMAISVYGYYALILSCFIILGNIFIILVVNYKKK